MFTFKWVLSRHTVMRKQEARPVSWRLVLTRQYVQRSHEDDDWTKWGFSSHVRFRDSLIMWIAASWLLCITWKVISIISGQHKLYVLWKVMLCFYKKYHVNWMLCSRYHLGSYFYSGFCSHLQSKHAHSQWNLLHISASYTLSEKKKIHSFLFKTDSP